MYRTPLPTKPHDPDVAQSQEDLPLPAHRDHLMPTAAAKPDPLIEQAKRDLDRGLVDTDMHGIAGLDARRRARLVPGPGGSPPTLGAPVAPADPESARQPTVTIKVGRLSRSRCP